MESVAQNQLQILPGNIDGESGPIIDPSLQSVLLASEADLLTNQVALPLVEQMASDQQTTAHSFKTSTPSKPKESQESERSFDTQKLPGKEEKQHSFTTKPLIKDSLKERCRDVYNQSASQSGEKTSKNSSPLMLQTPQFQPMPKKGEKAASPLMVFSQSREEQPVQKNAKGSDSRPNPRSKQPLSKSSSPTQSTIRRTEQNLSSSPLSFVSHLSSHPEKSQLWREQQEQEGGEQHKQQQEQEEKQNQHEETQKVDKISAVAATSNEGQPIANSLKKEILDFGMQESSLSKFSTRRTSHFDVLLLFIEILKLSIKSRREERIARLQEHALQLEHMENVVMSYKTEGKGLYLTGVGSLVFGIASGAIPIAGYIQGESILSVLSQAISSLGGMNPQQQADFFDKLGKITFTMSEAQKTTGNIQSAFTQGDRYYDERRGDLHKTEGEESTRTIDEIKDSWRGIEQFLYQTLQMYHDAARQLYGQGQ
ncbi:MAG: hypothetical protein WAM28_09115 [Chlamydiales bacterium]